MNQLQRLTKASQRLVRAVAFYMLAGRCKNRINDGFGYYGPFASPLAHSLAPLTRSLCSALLTSLVRSSALIRSLLRLLTPALMGKGLFWMDWMRRFHIVLTHCAAGRRWDATDSLHLSILHEEGLSRRVSNEPAIQSYGPLQHGHRGHKVKHVLSFIMTSFWICGLPFTASF